MHSGILRHYTKSTIHNIMLQVKMRWAYYFQDNENFFSQTPRLSKACGHATKQTSTRHLIFVDYSFISASLYENPVGTQDATTLCFPLPLKTKTQHRACGKPHDSLWKQVIIHSRSDKIGCAF